MADKKFGWKLGSAPPLIEAHSDAKLELIELYLNRYFDVLAVNPAQEKLSISFVDGFSGGGQYTGRDGDLRPGSPFVLLNAVKRASVRLNASRRKPLVLDARFYFVETKVETADFLRSELATSEHAAGLRDGSITIDVADFERVSATIVADIKARQRQGRSIFILDQKGWSLVQFATIRSILNELPRAEIVLTFAVDWLMAYMTDSETFDLAMRRAGFTQGMLQRYLQLKGAPGFRYVLPRLLMQDIRELTGAAYFTPFFIRSDQAKRDLWIIHLSKLTVARNVMADTHWDVSNASRSLASGATSLHQGGAGLQMLGFDPHWQDGLPLDFGFDQAAEAAITDALLAELPRKLFEYDDGLPPTLDSLLTEVANHTAATRAQIVAALHSLHLDREIEIITPGGRRKRSSGAIEPTDRLRVPRQTWMFRGRS